MARFSAEFLEDLRARVPVSEIVGKRIKLRKAGREMRGLSPFNTEKTPSFFVNDQKAAWFDFSSGKNGNIFDFLMQTEGASFPEAVERIASMAGVPLPNVTPEAVKQEEQRKSLRDVIEMAAKFFERELAANGGAAREYLTSRGIDEKLIQRFRIGWAPNERFELKEHLGAAGIPPESMIEAGLLIHGDDIPVPYDKFRGRVVFPIADARGRVVGFGGRAMGDEQPKYLNSPETPLFKKGSLLYNAHAARLPAFKGDQPLVAVEGYTDVIALTGVGYEATVASLGTAFTSEHLAGLWRMADEPILCFDGDAAGGRAISKAIDVALPMLAPGRSLRFAVLPPGQDPDELARKGGKEAVSRVLGAARPLVDVLWSREADPVMEALTTPEKRATFEARIKAVVGQIADEAIRRHYADDLFARARTLIAAPKEAVGGPPKRKHRAEFDYHDAQGHLLYQVVTYDPDGMTFRRPDAEEDGVWVWGLVAGEYMRKGDGHDWYRYDEQYYVEWGCKERRQIPAVAATVPYGAAAVAEAITDERMVWVTRSEELADALADRGLVATTAAGGTRGVNALATGLKGGDVMLLVEHDDPGRQFAHVVAMKLRGVASRVRILDIAQYWTACPVHGGLVDWWDAGGTEDGLYAIVEQIPDWKPTPPQSLFGAIRHIDIDLPAREHAWLIKGVLTQGELSILAGARSSGKSFCALDEAYAVARAVEEQGLTWFGRRVHGGLVLYQAGEGKLGLRKRMRAYRDYNQMAKDRDLPLVLLPKEMNLHQNDDHTQKIIAEGRAWSAFYGLPVVLLVIDTFAKATTGANENASEDMSRVLDRGARISEALGCHVQFVHHLNAGGTKVRGHSSLMGNVENAIEIETTEAKEYETIEGGREVIRAIREARITKQKDDESGGHWNFVLKQVIVGRDNEGDPITSCVVCPTREAALPAVSHASKDNVGVLLNEGRVIFFRNALLTALDEKGIPPPPELKLPRSVERVVEWDFVKIAYRNKVAPDEIEAKAKKDTLKTYVKRHREYFTAANIMGLDTVTSKDGAVEIRTTYVWTTGKPVFGKGLVWPTRKKVEPDQTPILDPVSGERMDVDLPF